MQAQEIWQLFVPLFSDYLHNSGVIYRDVKVRSSRWYEVKHLKTTSDDNKIFDRNFADHEDCR